MRKLFLILITVFCAQLSNAQPSGYQPVKDLARFKEQFGIVAKKTETIKSEFTQEKNLSMLSEKITSKGKFWFKKDNLLRMEYNKPFEYLMILNNGNMYVKDKQKESKISTKSNKLFQQVNKITIDCVQGTIFANTDFSTKVYENKSNYQIELVPNAKALKELFSSINVVVDKAAYAVNSIEMVERSGDNTLISFTNKEINTPIPDALFTIK